MSLDTKNLYKNFKEKELGKKVIKKLKRRRLSLTTTEYCDICCESFRQLQSHIDVIHKGIRKYESSAEIHRIKCESCDSVFTGHILKDCQYNLSLHIRTVHEGEKNFKCYLCIKAFRHPWHVKRHINAIHKKIKPISCDVCGKSFAEKRNIKKHHCKGAQKCDLCEKVYPSKTSLKMHKKNCDKQNVHKESTTFWCDICNEKYLEESLLSEHITVAHLIDDFEFVTNLKSEDS